MIDLLKSLSGTPLPTILVISGIFFLFLSLAGGVSGKIELPEKRQLYTGICGTILLILGLGIYLIPPQEQHAGESSSEAPGENATDSLVEELVAETETSEPYFMDWPATGEEDFSYFDNDWYTGVNSFEGVTVEQLIVDGVYRWNLNFNRPYYFYQPSPYAPSANAYIACDLRFSTVSSDTSYNQVQAGLMFRKTENKDYRLYIDSNGYMKIVYYENGYFNDLTDWLRVPEMDPSVFNRFAVVTDNNLIKIYMNERLVYEWKDHTSSSGTVALVTESYGPVSAIVEFDNIEYRIKPEVSN